LTKTKIFITGSPGVGKTTVINKLYDKLNEKMSLSIKGFITTEMRRGGDRVGFEIKTFSKDQTALIAHVDEIKSSTKVGKYAVNIENFEKYALPEIKENCDIRLIDEIGKMECFSDKFIQAMRELLEKEKELVVSTISQKGEGFISEAKNNPDVDLIEITRDNRDEMPQILYSRIESLLKKN